MPERETLQPDRIWKTGERCILHCQGRSCPATVTLASGNGRSLFLDFEALLAGFAGAVALSWQDEPPGFVSLLTATPFELSENEPGDAA